MTSQTAFAKIDFLEPAPTQPLGYYNYFGKVLSPQEAAGVVANKGLDPNDPISYQRVGAVKITQELIAQGENIFLNRKIGDTFGLQGVFGFGQGFNVLSDEIGAAIANLYGQSTTNLKITLQKDLTIGSRTFPKGTVIPTGLKVEQGQVVVVGSAPNGDITCAICHATLSNKGKILAGVPNSELAIPLLIALSPNTAAGFARLNFNPLDPQYKGNGKTIIDSKGNKVELPDPEKFEKAFDDAVLDVPFGNFESSPDGIRNTTQIPSVFTFQDHPYLADGQFAVGPFAGLSAVNNAVHSSEINLFAAAQISAETLGIDPEVYIGTLLQNAAVPSLRLPEGLPVQPSQWLRGAIAPNPTQAELEDQISAPGTGTYPNLRPSLFTYNGLIFSPNTQKPNDIASGTFLFADNAMSAFQNSLVPPANQTSENWQALNSNSVKRGAKIFEKANCATCHIPPFFTDNKIHPIDEIRTNSARAQSRLGLNNLLVPPKLYTFNTPVPIPASAEVLDVPTEGISDSPTTLPKGILPKGGYKTSTLRGLYLSAPYLHDGGAAVQAGSLAVDSNGSFTVVNKNGLGLSGTLSQGIPADAASSLRALVDRDLRTLVVKANKANPALVRSNLDGTGHDFYVDRQAGFNSKQQADLINFLLALDDNPGSF
ncbi:MAG: di-heme oxidoredictase family protein [Nostoc sp. DedVER02]|uniref:di-heme oxidoredictase family protein n=1 Tax=unclassified Nostoc TaxID=2593658 RepID=UPI002AD1D4DA|nr:MULTISPECIES: di-heme oxidoredictase family protein [unclassified Nostoc]MDZ7988496.1 di-heme oxidoredictase family protein [Nostoc sp. DedVER02]MDZ8112899.1 di-heme oxidoredictase family protein [Nostoc sp. DedVER01b]